MRVILQIRGRLFEGRKGNVLFDDTLNTFYLRLYGIGHMVKDHSDSERGNPLPPLVGVPYNDFKHCINQYIFSTWQEQCDPEQASF